LTSKEEETSLDTQYAQKGFSKKKTKSSTCSRVKGWTTKQQKYVQWIPVKRL